MENNTITNKDLYFHYTEKLGISNEDAVVLMKLALASKDEVLPQANVRQSVPLNEDELQKEMKEKYGIRIIEYVKVGNVA